VKVCVHAYVCTHVLCMRVGKGVSDGICGESACRYRLLLRRAMEGNRRMGLAEVRHGPLAHARIHLWYIKTHICTPTRTYTHPHKSTTKHVHACSHTHVHTHVQRMGEKEGE